MCVEIIAESKSQADRVKYSILLDADDRSKEPVSHENLPLYDATGRQLLDCGDRSWICNAPRG